MFAISKSSLGCVIAKGTYVNIEQNIEIDSNIEAPITEGKTLGKISFTIDGETIAECDLISYNDVRKINFISMNKFVLGNWLNLFR